MIKFFSSLVTVVVLAAASGGCASVGYTGLTGLSVPGYEAAPVTAANAAMPYQILAAGQQGWSPYGQQFGYANVPVCRLQDLQGLPPVNQPVLVRVDKTRGHKVADILGAATVVGGIAYLNSGYSWQAAMAGGATGGGGGLLWTNHEQDLCLLLPVQTLSSFLVRVMNPTQAAVMLYDGGQELGVIPAGRHADLPPAANGYRAVLVGSIGRPSEAEAELIQPDPQKRFLEIRPK